MKESTPSNLDIQVSRTDQLLVQSVARLDRSALGTALGVTLGIIIFTATIFLILKGGNKVGPTLSLLNQYFPGYSVTLAGSFVGLFYGFVSGFVIGWSLAFFRNLVIIIYLHIANFKGRLMKIQDVIDS